VRFLVDESTGPAVARWLREQGHDAVAVRDVARGAEDEDVLRKAAVEKRILIANDKDFGEMIFRRRQPHAGAVLLRLSDETDENKIRVMEVRVCSVTSSPYAGRILSAALKRRGWELPRCEKPRTCRASPSARG
jgi:predicted nuclease of predicted toxin-antitoxin system